MLSLVAQDDENRGPQDDELDPQTRASFNLLRETYPNTAAFVADLLGDRMLQKRLRAICHVIGPLHSEYVYDLQQHSAGQESVVRWHGDRASGRWYRVTVVKTLALLSDTSIINLFDLYPQPMNGKGALWPHDPRVQQEKRLLEQYAAFAIELMANRCWSQAFWTLSLPYCAAGIFATAIDDRVRCQNFCLNLATAILKLEDLMLAKPNHASLRQLYDDLGACEWQLTRELLVMIMKPGFSWQNPDFRRLCFSIFGGPGCTKDCLESCFNHLKDSLRASKAKKFNLFTKYFYCLMNPYAQHAGVKNIVPGIYWNQDSGTAK